MTRRRWVLGGLGTVAALGVVAGALWWAWVPHWRPALRDDERYGIDVASHQGVIDWSAVSRDDIDFVYVKATEGGDFTDGRFVANWQGTADVGLQRGAYHFFTLCRPGDEQAEHFLETVPDDAELAPAVDLELAGNCADRPPAADVAAEVDAFVRTVEAEVGEEVLLYVGDDWEREYPTRDRLDRDLWHRRWFLRPDVDGWTVWQFTGRGAVDGIDGDVDLNVMRPA